MTALQHLGLQKRNIHDLGFINVLIAEDDTLSADMLQRLLTSWKANVTIAHSSEEAVSKAGSRRFDLILTDLQMSDMEGLEAVRQLKDKASGSAPIIALSDCSDLTSRTWKAAGISECLHKPFSNDELYDVIDHNMYQELRLVC